MGLTGTLPRPSEDLREAGENIWQNGRREL
jgi:hypothetical protein